VDGRKYVCRSVDLTTRMYISSGGDSMCVYF